MFHVAWRCMMKCSSWAYYWMAAQSSYVQRVVALFYKAVVSLLLSLLLLLLFIVTKIVTLTMSQNKYNYNLYTTYIILCIILVSCYCDFHAWVSRYMWCYGVMEKFYHLERNDFCFLFYSCRATHVNIASFHLSLCLWADYRITNKSNRSAVMRVFEVLSCIHIVFLSLFFFNLSSKQSSEVLGLYVYYA